MLLRTYVFNCLYYLVPVPTVMMEILNNQTVGQPLTLQCSVTTVRGITSRVDIVWSSNSLEIKRTKEVNFSSVKNSSILVEFVDLYIIPQLNTTDEDRVYHCKVFIDSETSVNATESVSLNVTG